MASIPSAAATTPSRSATLRRTVLVGKVGRRVVDVGHAQGMAAGKRFDHPRTHHAVAAQDEHVHDAAPSRSAPGNANSVSASRIR